MSTALTRELHLFGGPYVLVDGQRFNVPEGSKRLVAFVALQGPRIERRRAAGVLWPNGSDARAAGNLRSSLWRLRTTGIDVLRTDKWSLGLREDVAVDVEDARRWADRVLSGPCPEDLRLMPWCVAALDLLPGWYDDWVLAERESFRQRMLHALEALSRALLEVGRHAAATEVGMLVASHEPLRESSQRVLIEAHLAEGNYVVAWRTFCRYRAMLADELGTEPSRDLTALLHRAPEPMTLKGAAALLPMAP